MTTLRIGHGYDVHRLEDGLRLVLGGTEIAYGRGCVAHSDGDVLLHAVCDALLGAAALGDIGRHFPPDDSEFEGISSILLLERTAGLLADAGWQPVNIDCTVIAQAPRLAPYVETMRANIAKAAGMEVCRVSVKATTEEKLGITGSGEGNAAHAVALIEKIS